MGLDALKDEWRSMSFSKLRMERQVKERFMDLVRQSSVTFFPFLEEFTDYIPVNHSLFKYFHGMGIVFKHWWAN